MYVYRAMGWGTRVEEMKIQETRDSKSDGERESSHRQKWEAEQEGRGGGPAPPRQDGVDV